MIATVTSQAATGDAELMALAAEIEADIDARMTPEEQEAHGRKARAWMFRKYLEALFSPYEPTGWANLRAVRGRSSQSYWIPLETIQAEGERKTRFRGAWQWGERLNMEGWAIYCGALPRETQGEGGKSSIRRAAWLWSDVDFKVAGEDAAFSAVERFPSRADIVVLTGGGIHPYWRLEKPADFTQDDPRRFERKVRKLQDALLPGCDPTQNVDRILRVPGFYNWKNPDNPHLVTLAAMPAETWRKG